MNGLNWIKVLEIETYLNMVMKANATWIEVTIWEEGKKHNMTLDKSYFYTPQDVKDYLFNKYPSNQFLRDMEHSIDALYNSLIIGNRIIEVDEDLYNINLNKDKLQVSDTEQRLKFLEGFNQRLGVDIYWYSILKETIKKHRISTAYDRNKVENFFLQAINSNLLQNIGISIDDFDSSVIDKNWNLISSSHLIEIELFSKFDILKGEILNFKENLYYNVFKKMCAANNYNFFYEDKEPNVFLKDSIAFSISLCLKRIKNGENNFFSYELRKSTSLFPQDLIKNPYKTLIIYVTPFGFHSHEKVDELFQEKKLLEIIKRLLSDEFEIVNKESVVDNEYGITEWDRFNSSLIVGKNLNYNTFWGRKTKKFIDKLIGGTIWFNDDVHGPVLKFIELFPKSAYEGEQKCSMPAENALYYCSELRLEKTLWEREIRDIYDSGYSDNVDENENEFCDDDEY